VAGAGSTADFDAAREVIRAHGHAVSLDPGELLFREGEEALAVYLVLEGSLQVIGLTSDGREMTLRRLDPGAVLGEQAIVGPRPGLRTASVRAAERSALLEVGRDAFLRALSASDPVRGRMRALSDRNARDQLMRRSQLFGSLGSSIVANERRIGPRQILFREGDAADRVYLILSGRAAAYRTEGGRLRLLTKIGPGRCVGELAVIHGGQRSASVVSETELHVLEVEAADFVERLYASPELRDQMSALERVYQLPASGIMAQYSGRILGEEAITSVYQLDDGRRFAASLLVGTDVFHFTRAHPPVETTGSGLIRHGRAELTLTAGGLIVGFTASNWPGVPTALLRAIKEIALNSEEQSEFERTGSLAEVNGDEPIDDPVLCICVHVTRAAVEAAIREGATTAEDLRRSLACGTVCGGCMPRIAVRLGDSDWTNVEVVNQHHLTADIRAFRFRPLGRAPMPWRPGQHIIVSAFIDGLWIERPYTLSGPPDADTYEITVKREPLGVFSRWLFERGADLRLRVSRPRGAPGWQAGADQMLCFVAVTPAIAACRALQGHLPHASIHIDYSGRTAQSLAYVDDLRAIRGVTLTVRETAVTGRLSVREVQGLVQRYPGARAFICGPRAYMAHVSASLEAVGLDKTRQHMEVFTHVGGPVEQAGG
jgi:ferredoxin-NADP reductase/CRP-like cAMP-binding protein/bacterioferritin-associated ferredoxin